MPAFAGYEIYSGAKKDTAMFEEMRALRKDNERAMQYVMGLDKANPEINARIGAKMQSDWTNTPRTRAQKAHDISDIGKETPFAKSMRQFTNDAVFNKWNQEKANRENGG